MLGFVSTYRLLLDISLRKRKNSEVLNIVKNA